MSKYIRCFVFVLLFFFVMNRPQEASAKYFSTVNADIVSCPAFGDIESYVGNNAYIHIQWHRSNCLREYLFVYDYPPSRIELWWNTGNYDSIKVHAIDGGGSEYDAWRSYSRITYDGQEKGGFSSFSGDSVAYWLNDEYADIQIKYYKIDKLNVLYETFDSSVLVPTPTSTPTPTTAPTPITKVDMSNTGFTESMSVALEFMRIPIEIAGFEVNMFEIMMFGFACTIVIYLVFAPVKK